MSLADLTEESAWVLVPNPTLARTHSLPPTVRTLTRRVLACRSRQRIVPGSHLKRWAVQSSTLAHTQYTQYK
jgi:hypothetical protein